MNMPPSFTGIRPIANHCAELIRPGPRPELRAELIEVWRRELSLALAGELEPLLAGAKLAVNLSEPEQIAAGALFKKVGPAAVNILLRLGDDHRSAVLSLDLATGIALTDRSFGGAGTAPDDLPDLLPRSAGMLLDQVAAIIAQTLCDTAHIGTGEVLVRSENIKRLNAFDEGAELVALTLTFAQGEVSWPVRIAMESVHFDAILPTHGARLANSGSNSPNPNQNFAGIAQMPLPLDAVLSDVNMPLGKLERLVPGQEIPIAIPRELPLRIGETVMAHGTIGTADQQLALRLTRISGNRKGAAT